MYYKTYYTNHVMLAVFIIQHVCGLRFRLRVPLRQMQSEHALRYVAQVQSGARSPRARVAC